MGEARWNSASKGVGPGIGGKMSLSVLTLEPTLTIGSSGPAWLSPAFLRPLCWEVGEREH